jgi:hypothetical protein
VQDLGVDVLVDVGLLMVEAVGCAEKYVRMPIYPEDLGLSGHSILIRIDTACFG